MSNQPENALDALRTELLRQINSDTQQHSDIDGWDAGKDYEDEIAAFEAAVRESAGTAPVATTCAACAEKDGEIENLKISVESWMWNFGILERENYDKVEQLEAEIENLKAAAGPVDAPKESHQ